MESDSAVNPSSSSVGPPGGGNRIIIPGTTKAPSTGTKFTISVKGSKATSGAKNPTGAKANSKNEVLIVPLGGGDARSREATTAKEEKLRKAQEAVNRTRQRSAEPEQQKKAEEERQAAFNRAQKERVQKQEEETRRRKEEERRRHERELKESAERRSRAREERANIERTIDFDADQRALQELTELVGVGLDNVFDSRMKEESWEVEDEPFQGSETATFYRPMVRA